MSSLIARLLFSFSILLCQWLCVTAFSEEQDAVVSDPGRQQQVDVQKLFEEGYRYQHGLDGQHVDYVRAARYFERAAQFNHSGALYSLGELVEYGDGVDIDLTHAMSLFNKSSDRGNASAQYMLGLFWSQGLVDGHPSNEGLAILHYYFAALAGNTAAQMTLGFRHLYGHGVPKSCQTAVLYYTPVADKVVAIHSAGVSEVVEKMRLAEEGDNQRSKGEEEEIVQYYQFSADKGDVHAQLALGHLHYYGARGLQQDHARAFTYFQRAAQQGDVGAMSSLGHMYAQGLGVEQDNETAIHYFQQAAKKGHASAQNGLGFMYMNGYGIPQDYQQAFKYFSLSAEQSNSEGQFNLGALHIGGLGTKKDYGKAMHYFTLAAHQGHTLAMHNLALMHLNGLGTPRSCPMAVSLLKTVSERGPWAKILKHAHRAYLEGNLDKSFLLYLQAAEQGFEVAQHNAGWLMEHHIGFIRDDDDRWRRALRVLNWAAEQGNVDAELRIGDHHYYGLATPVDYERAAAHYRAASDKRNAQASFNLGYMYQFGIGIPQDSHLAKRFYDSAAEAHPDAFVPTLLALTVLRWQTHYPKLLETIYETDWEAILIALLCGSLGIVLYLLSRREVHVNPNTQRVAVPHTGVTPIRTAEVLRPQEHGQSQDAAAVADT